MKSIADKYEKYQFTYDERREILGCVKDYFNLTKQERCARRYLDFDKQNESRGWFTKYKLFNYKIPVLSWPDELNNVDLNQIEQIYLNKNYYELIPFENSMTYTERVMSKFLKYKSNEFTIEKQATENSSRINGESFIDERSNKTSDEDKHNCKKGSNLETFDCNENSESMNHIENSNYKKKLTNQLSLIKQRLINEKVWLSEQQKLNEERDENDNYLSYFNDYQNEDLNEEISIDESLKSKKIRKANKPKIIQTYNSSSKKSKSKQKTKKVVKIDTKISYAKTRSEDIENLDSDLELENLNNFDGEDTLNEKFLSLNLFKKTKKIYLILLIILFIYLKFMSFL